VGIITVPSGRPGSGIGVGVAVGVGVGVAVGVGVGVAVGVGVGVAVGGVYNMALQKPGVGSNYALTTGDKNGDILYGEKTYKVTLPANVPAKDFWSMVAYDPQTRSELQVPGRSLYPSKNNKRDKLVYNEDGSVTLYFGPQASKGKPKANWTETTPGKAWFAMLRLYGPLQPWFDKTWKPGDFELVE